MEREILALGMAYYKNIIPEPQLLIEKIENLENKRAESASYKSLFIRPWQAWDYDQGGKENYFLLAKIYTKTRRYSNRWFVL